MVAPVEGGMGVSGSVGITPAARRPDRKYYPAWDRWPIEPSASDRESTGIGSSSRTGKSDDPGVTGGTWTMAERRRSGAHATGARSRVAVSSRAVGAGSVAGSGSSTSTDPRAALTVRPQAPANHDPATRATYRLLLLKGLAADEAANLTAYLCGLPIGQAGWSLSEVNRLLFLRELSRTGHWGVDSDKGRLH
jgi:hypothetical protein